jgi:hypothetical protein
MKSPWCAGTEAENRLVSNTFDRARELNDWMESKQWDINQRLSASSFFFAGLLASCIHEADMPEAVANKLLTDTQKLMYDFLAQRRKRM